MAMLATDDGRTHYKSHTRVFKRCDCHGGFDHTSQHQFWALLSSFVGGGVLLNSTTNKGAVVFS